MSISETAAAADGIIPPVLYQASCHCGAVRYSLTADPVDAKLCHCGGCAKQHGAPMQWAAIMNKQDVHFADESVPFLRYYNNEMNRHERLLPCKVSCSQCDTLIADEGRRMWLLFPSLLDFGSPPSVPIAFQPKCHIFYSQRLLDMKDGKPKWSGHKNQSTLMTEDE